MAISFFLLLMANMFQGMFLEWQLCRPFAGAVVMVLLLLTNQIRTLNHVAYLSATKLAIMIVIIVLCLVSLAKTHRPETVVTELFGSPSVWDVFNVLGICVFTFGGQDLFVEIMHDSAEPEKFVDALWISGSMAFVTYAIFGLLGYYFAGTSVRGLILDMMCNDVLRRITYIMVFLDGLVSFVLRQQVATQQLCLWVLPQMITDPEYRNSCCSYLIWFGLTPGRHSFHTRCQTLFLSLKSFVL